MRNLALVFCAFMLLAWPLQADEQISEFFQSIPDVPLMEGMHEMQDYILVFDKPEGRIIETLAHTDDIPVAQIRQYYELTLPQLGWKKTDQDEFVREEEKLSMQYEQDFLKISVRPKD